MKKLIPLLFIFNFSFFISYSQLVATVELKQPIPGICNNKAVYALFSGFKGQTEPVAPISKEDLQTKLNNEVKFLKDNPKFKGKMMINLFVNCNGDMVQCNVDNKSGNDDLDSQVLAIFKTMLKWTPGRLDGSGNVDCSVLYSIEIKKGVLKLT